MGGVEEVDGATSICDQSRLQPKGLEELYLGEERCTLILIL